MNIPKQKASEYLGIQRRRLSELIKEGRLKNHDTYHVTLDSLIDYVIEKRKENNKPTIISASIEGMRIVNEKTMIIDFTSRKSLLGFFDRLTGQAKIKLIGKFAEK